MPNLTNTDILNSINQNKKYLSISDTNIVNLTKQLLCSSFCSSFYECLRTGPPPQFTHGVVDFFYLDFFTVREFLFKMRQLSRGLKIVLNLKHLNTPK